MKIVVFKDQSFVLKSYYSSLDANKKLQLTSQFSNTTTLFNCTPKQCQLTLENITQNLSIKIKSILYSRKKKQRRNKA